MQPGSDLVYVDTSALVPLFVREPISGQVQARIASLPAGVAALSDWVLLEFDSAIAGRVRGGSLSRSHGREAIRACEALVQASFQFRPVSGADFATARAFVADFGSGLRAGDALHLAVAQRLSARLFTLDRVHSKAARAAGVGMLY